jgi:arylsulfatase A
LSRRPMYWEFFGGGFQQAARRGSIKAVKPKPDGPIELYDLSSDPDETKDVAPDHPELVEWFARFFEEARTESEHWPVR